MRIRRPGATPPAAERHFSDGASFDGVDHRSGAGHDRDVLGDGVRAIAEDEDIAGHGGTDVALDEMAACGGEYGLCAGGLTPVTSVGRHRLGFAAVQRAPYAANEAEAVRADAAHARLMMIRRAKPAPRLGDDMVARIGHGVSRRGWCVGLQVAVCCRAEQRR